MSPNASIDVGHRSSATSARVTHAGTVTLVLALSFALALAVEQPVKASAAAHRIVSVTQPSANSRSTRNTWATIAPLPTARGDLAAVSIKGQVYAIGGEDATYNFTNTVEVYSPKANAWAAAPPMLVPRANLVGVAGHDGRIYAIGGRSVVGGVTTDVSSGEAYSPTSRTWTAIAPMPEARTDMGGTVGRDGRIYVVGGSIASGTTNTALAYSPVTNTWTPIAAMPTAREALAVALGRDGRIYAFGGYTTRSGAMFDTVEAYSPKTNTWATLAPMPQPMLGMSAVSDHDIYLIGGRSGGPGLVSVWRYSTSLHTWTAEAPMPTGRWSLAVTKRHGILYALGGYTFDRAGNFQILGAAEAYTPAVRA